MIIRTVMIKISFPLSIVDTLLIRQVTEIWIVLIDYQEKLTRILDIDAVLLYTLRCILHAYISDYVKVFRSFLLHVLKLSYGSLYPFTQ